MARSSARAYGHCLPKQTIATRADQKTSCRIDALFVNLQNCVGSTRHTRVYLINPLPIFVVKLQTITSIIIWFSYARPETRVT